MHDLLPNTAVVAMAEVFIPWVASPGESLVSTSLFGRWTRSHNPFAVLALLAFAFALAFALNRRGCDLRVLEARWSLRAINRGICIGTEFA